MIGDGIALEGNGLLNYLTNRRNNGGFNYNDVPYALDILENYRNPVRRAIGAPIVRSADTLRKLAEAREKRARRRLDSFAAGGDLLSTNLIPTGEAVGNNITNYVRFLVGASRLPIDVKVVRGKFAYMFSGSGKVSTNWSELRKSIGKQSPAYFSPIFRIVTNWNKIMSATDAQDKIDRNNIPLSDLQARYFKNAIRGAYLKSRKLNLNEAYRQSVEQRNLDVLANSKARYNRRIQNYQALLGLPV